MNILLVEDEPLIQKSLKILLEKQGAIVHAEHSGKRAIEAINMYDFDRIICDIMLQDTTGFDVIDRAKERYHGDISKKFIMITAYNSLNILNRASYYNCRILSKPFKDIDKVISILMSQE